MVTVSSLVDQPLMTNEWSGVVKNFKMPEIRHVTYHFDGNFVLILKIISKIIERGHLRSNDSDDGPRKILKGGRTGGQSRFVDFRP